MAMSLVPLVSAGVPEGKKVVRDSAAIQAQIEQVEKDLAAAKKNEEEYLLRFKRQVWVCGNDLIDSMEKLRKARERLEELQSNNEDTAKVEAAKAEVAKCVRHLRELNSEITSRPISDPIDVEKSPEVLDSLRRKVADLLTARDKLKEELRERNTPAKKAP